MPSVTRGISVKNVTKKVISVENNSLIYSLQFLSKRHMFHTNKKFIFIYNAPVDMYIKSRLLCWKTRTITFSYILS